MTTIRKELSTLRDIIEEHTDDSDMRDSLLYDVWNKARVDIYTKSKRTASPWNRKGFCVELVPAKAHDCTCVKVGCDILETKFPIPAPISNRYKGVITVMTIYGDIIGYSEEYAIKSDRTDEVKSGKIRWNIDNRKIRIYNHLELPAIRVEGVWQDVLDWQDIRFCEYDDCEDIMDIDIGLDEDHAHAILREAIRTIQPKIQLVDDWKQDRNPESR